MLCYFEEIMHVFQNKATIYQKLNLNKWWKKTNGISDVHYYISVEYVFIYYCVRFDQFFWCYPDG